MDFKKGSHLSVEFAVKIRYNKNINDCHSLEKKGIKTHILFRD